MSLGTRGTFSLELSSLLVIADFSLGSIVQAGKNLAITFSLSVAEIQHRAAIYQKEKK